MEGWVSVEGGRWRVEGFVPCVVWIRPKAHDDLQENDENVHEVETPRDHRTELLQRASARAHEERSSHLEVRSRCVGFRAQEGFMVQGSSWLGFESYGLSMV